MLTGNNSLIAQQLIKDSTYKHGTEYIMVEVTAQQICHVRM